MRKHLNFSTADYGGIDIEDVTKFLELHEDEIIQARLDLYGSQGTDLTKPESGTTYYRDWLEKKKEKASRREDDTKITKEEAERINNVFKYEIEKVVGRRHLKKVIG